MKKYFLTYVSVLSLFCCTASLSQISPENVPAFGSPIVDGIQLTIRLSEYDYVLNDTVNIECWMTNKTASNQTVCIFPLEFTLFARLEKDGKFFFDTEDGFVAAGDFAAGIGERKPSKEDYFELKPGWSLRIEEQERFVPLDLIIGNQLKLANQQISAGEYSLTLRFSQKVFNGEELGIKSWTGSVDSNTVKLRMLPTPDADMLLKQLDAPSAKARAKAVGALGKMKEPRAFDPLIAFLKDNDAQVRLNAAAALGSFADSRAVEPLIPLLEDKDALVARYAVKSLAKIGDKRAIQPLIKKLLSDSAIIKCDVLEALKMLPDAESASAIAILLKDRRRSVRYAALHSLPTLLVTDPEKRKTLAQSLMTATADEYFEIRGDAASTLVEFSDYPDAVHAISGLLKDRNPYVRLKAVLAIGQIKPAGAIELLNPLKEDSDKEVRDSASEAIRQLESPID